MGDNEGPAEKAALSFTHLSPFYYIYTYDHTISNYFFLHLYNELQANVCVCVLKFTFYLFKDCVCT